MASPRPPGERDSDDRESHGQGDGHGGRENDRTTPSDETLIDLGGDSGFLAAIPDDDDPFPDDAAVVTTPPPAAHPPGSTRSAPPPPPSPTSPQASIARGMVVRQPSDLLAPPEGSPALRDRVVILGRRASGKSVFLARLYHHLFRGVDGLSMQALDGPSHLRCIKAMDELSRGQWPAATAETAAIDLEIRFPGGQERLVALDYPGEVFRRAFVEEIAGPDVMALLDHVDRAAAVIILIDPGSAVGGVPGDLVEDDFGMVQALRRIRAAPRGDEVPVAIVLTKVDAHQSMLRAAGGLKPFVEKHYPSLVRAARGARVFGCAAVRAIPDPVGRRVPQIRGEPVGLVEPLVWCLTQMGRLRRSEQADALQSDFARRSAEEERAEAAAAQRERRVLAILWTGVAIVLIVGGFIAWYLLAP